MVCTRKCGIILLHLYLMVLMAGVTVCVMCALVSIYTNFFVLTQVVKSTMEFVRFEGEVENRSKLRVHISQLDSKTIKLSGFTETLKVRAAESKVDFPTRHDWDSYFRDAKGMNEMKFGERPDTVHIKDLPCRWFANRKEKDRDRPSEFIVRKVFETFGEVRCTT